jgi:hypothetical protein
MRNFKGMSTHFPPGKAQYQTLFKKFGWKKNRKSHDLRIVKRKVEKRKENGKQTAVYYRGNLMSEKQLTKEFSRHAPISIRDLIQEKEGIFMIA